MRTHIFLFCALPRYNSHLVFSSLVKEVLCIDIIPIEVFMMGHELHTPPILNVFGRERDLFPFPLTYLFIHFTSRPQASPFLIPPPHTAPSSSPLRKGSHSHSISTHPGTFSHYRNRRILSPTEAREGSPVGVTESRVRQ